MQLERFYKLFLVFTCFIYYPVLLSYIEPQNCRLGRWSQKSPENDEREPEERNTVWFSGGARSLQEVLRTLANPLQRTPTGITVHRILNVRGTCAVHSFCTCISPVCWGSSSLKSKSLDSTALLSSFTAVFGNFWHHLPDIRALPQFECE